MRRPGVRPGCGGPAGVRPSLAHPQPQGRGHPCARAGFQAQDDIISRDGSRRCASAIGRRSLRSATRGRPRAGHAPRSRSLGAGTMARRPVALPRSDTAHRIGPREKVDTTPHAPSSEHADGNPRSLAALRCRNGNGSPETNGNTTPFGGNRMDDFLSPVSDFFLSRPAVRIFEVPPPADPHGSESGGRWPAAGGEALISGGRSRRFASRVAPRPSRAWDRRGLWEL